MGTSKLHSIHEGFLNAAKEDDTSKEDSHCPQYADKDLARFDRTGSEKRPSEGFHDRHHGIERIEITVTLWNLAHGIDDRCEVHPDLNRKGHRKG